MRSLDGLEHGKNCGGQLAGDGFVCAQQAETAAQNQPKNEDEGIWEIGIGRVWHVNEGGGFDGRVQARPRQKNCRRYEAFRGAGVG